MSAASLLDIMRVGRCVSLMLRVRERCYGSKFTSGLWTFARCVSSGRGINVSHNTIHRLVIRFVPEFEKRWKRFARPEWSLGRAGPAPKMVAIRALYPQSRNEQRL
jgi:hypothetical protein